MYNYYIQQLIIIYQVRSSAMNEEFLFKQQSSNKLYIEQAPIIN